MIERKNYSHLDKPVGAYVHAVKHNGTLYVSGLTAFGSSAENGPMVDQAAVIMDQLSGIAQAEGTDLSALLKVTLFVTQLDSLGPLRQLLFGRYGLHLPASSLVQVNALFSPKINIEIEAILATDH